MHVVGGLTKLQHSSVSNKLAFEFLPPNRMTSVSVGVRLKAVAL